MLIETIALLAAGLFAGGAGFITVVEHPARLEYGTDFAIREFRPSFNRAHKLMAGLALLGFIAGALAWWQSPQPMWLIGALLMIANGPWTAVLIRPVNNQLLNPELDLSSDRATGLIMRWGRLHAVRSVFGAVGFVLFLLAVRGIGG